jgi:MoaE-MoaD fusion protein
MDSPTLVSITEAPLDLNAVVKSLALHSTGAVVVFTGVVRGITTKSGTRETRYLEYDAYREMAEAKMFQVVTEIRERWPSIDGIAIVQRIGRVHPQTPSVIIACSASHRDRGIFDAARYGIDRLKQIVPIWKKEIGTDGECWVEGDYLPRPGE